MGLKQALSEFGERAPSCLGRQDFSVSSQLEHFGQDLQFVGGGDDQFHASIGQFRDLLIRMPGVFTHKRSSGCVDPDPELDWLAREDSHASS